MKNKHQDQNYDSSGDFNDDLEVKSGFLDEGKELDLEAGDFLPESEGEGRKSKKKTKKEKSQEGVVISRTKVVLIKKLLENVKENNDKIIEILSVLAPGEEEARIGISQIGEEADDNEITPGSGEETGKVIEGVFDGENMIGPDGKEYSVPANYASKSKLVEGDILKLTIANSGTFIYKQIGPIERTRIIGELKKGGDGDFFVESEGKKWHVLPASVTYFKGNPGDETVILIPKTGESKWAAVENIIRKRE
ncbi:MAG: hypothetical protein PHZ04_01670 [Patescibacteria group bacterium]|nr:hypothetical protein [Patescibacteria group bacterium]MDD5294978.1 hypothetical protein [Patescibacteria group bacterium]MDD5554773.1 hypothetical protein [Patescibacteria group bacterium]